jgi:uncharacterized protein (DUF2141 family)
MANRPIGSTMALAMVVAVMAVHHPAAIQRSGQPPGGNPPSSQQPPVRDRGVQAEPVPGTSQISGRVYAADTGRPIKRARIIAAAPEVRQGRVASTDDQGRYLITELPAGRYTITATKAGFVTMAFGQRRPQRGASPVQIGDNQQLANADIGLLRGGVITGRLVDEDGEPLSRIAVRAMRYQYQQGERRLVAAGADQTDDRGEYRIFGLPPGDYVVNATAQFERVVQELAAAIGRGRAAGRGGGGGRGGLMAGLAAAIEDESDSTGYAPTWYPGVVSAVEAGRITLGAGQEMTSIDFQLRLVKLARIRGTLVGPEGPVANGMVVLEPDDGAGGLFRGMQLRASPQADGTFTFNEVPPGRYAVYARGAAGTGLGAVVAGRGGRGGRGGGRGFGPAEGALFAATSVNIVGEDVSDLFVRLMPGSTVTGVVSFNGASPVPEPDALANVRVTLSPATPMPLAANASGRANEDATFSVAGVAAGPQIIRAAGIPRPWMLEGVYVSGRDVTDGALDIKAGQDVSGVNVVFTDRVTQLSGVVRDGQDQPAFGVTVIVFSTEALYWRPMSRRIQAMRVDQTGTFQFRGLPAGSYFLAPVEDVEQGEWFDPTYLDQVKASATRVTLTDGQTTTENITVR